MDDDLPLSKYVIKVDGEEIDRAETRAEARRYRNALIYCGIGTENTTTIELRRRSGSIGRTANASIVATPYISRMPTQRTREVGQA